MNSTQEPGYSTSVTWALKWWVYLFMVTGGFSYVWASTTLDKAGKKKTGFGLKAIGCLLFSLALLSSNGWENMKDFFDESQLTSTLTFIGAILSAFVIDKYGNFVSVILLAISYGTKLWVEEKFDLMKDDFKKHGFLIIPLLGSMITMAAAVKGLSLETENMMQILRAISIGGGMYGWIYLDQL